MRGPTVRLLAQWLTSLIVSRGPFGYAPATSRLSMQGHRAYCILQVDLQLADSA